MSVQNGKIFVVLAYSELRKYFKHIPPEHFIVKKLLPCFDYKSLNDTDEIGSCMLIPIIEKIKYIIPDICYYIEDASIKKAYIYNYITFYKVIIMFRNFLNCVGYTIMRRKVNYLNSTRVCYSLFKIKDFQQFSEKDEIDFQISFPLKQNKKAEEVIEKFKIVKMKKLMVF